MTECITSLQYKPVKPSSNPRTPIKVDEKNSTELASDLHVCYDICIPAAYITYTNKRITGKKNHFHFITEPVYTKVPICRIVLWAVVPRTLHG